MVLGPAYMRDEKDRLEAITKAAFEFFKGDEEAAKRWLNLPVRGLGDKRPVNMVHTDEDTKTTINLIGCPDRGMIV